MNLAREGAAVAHEGFVWARDLRLHYLEWNPSAQDVIVLLHGLRGEASGWTPVAEALAADYRVLALDQRGRGFSDWAPDADYSRAAYVQDLERFAAELHLPPFVLVGQSMGGANAVAFAATRPELVTALILSEPAIFLPGSERAPGQSRIPAEVDATPTFFESWDAALAYLQQTRPDLSSSDLPQFRRTTLTELADGRVTWRYDLDGIRRSMHARRGEHAQDTLWAQVDQIRCPTLLLRAAQSDVVSPDMVAAFQARVPGVRLVEIPRAGHRVYVDNLPEFNRAVAAFLEGLRLSAGASHVG
jgi:pimeloyl-ACP methyl ester carboxylesterase